MSILFVMLKRKLTVWVWGRLPHSALIFHALAVALSHYFQKQTLGNGPTSEVSACVVSVSWQAPLLSFARVGHACHFETFNIPKNVSQKHHKHRRWSGPRSRSLNLAFCPAVNVLSQPAVWCHYNTRSHLKYWSARRRWEEGSESYEISWKADRAWFFLLLFFFSSAGLTLQPSLWHFHSIKTPLFTSPGRSRPLSWVSLYGLMRRSREKM